jgi:outer membrane protein assembly factor BamE (lipoprotein component of BamABCDE complex)
MPILVKCPQCQKAVTLPDEKRGTQVRCDDCFQVFLAGKPPAGGPAAAPPPPPAPKPAAKPAPAAKAAPRPQPAAAAKPAPKPAPRKAAPAPKPKPAAAPAFEFAAAADNPTTVRHRRRRKGGCFVLMLVLFLLLLLGGGGAAVVVGLWYFGKLPTNLIAAGPGAPKPPDKPGDGAPPKTDDTNPPKPPDKPADPVVNQANFDKIAKGMKLDDVTGVLGKRPNDHKETTGRAGDVAFIWKSADNQTSIEVGISQGKVTDKQSSANWPLSWPADAAQNPPPDKPGVVSQGNFDKIDKGMTEDDVAKLLGPPKYRLEKVQALQPGDVRLGWGGSEAVPDVVVVLHDGRVKDKQGSQGIVPWKVHYPSDVAQEPDAPGAGLTQANFDKIAKGMTQKEVEPLLGNKHDTVPAPNGTVVLGFHSKDLQTAAMVILQDGKVVDKNCTANWPVVWPADVAQNPPDKAAPGVTQANFDRIAKGMTIYDLTDLLGNTPGADLVTPEGVASVQWSDAKTVAITVDLASGKVKNKKSSLNWPVVWPALAVQDPPDKNPRVTQDNFAKIDKGMTKADLVALFGPPADTQLFHGAPGVKGPDMELVWVDGDKRIHIRLDHNKVMYKANLQGWPQDFPSDLAKNPPPDNPPAAGKGRPWLEKQPDDNGVYGSAIALHGRVFAFSGGETGIQFWDVVTGKEIKTLKGDDRPSQWLALASDGKQVASAELPNGGFKLRSMDGGGVNDEFGFRDGVDFLAFAPDDKGVVVASHKLIPGKLEPVSKITVWSMQLQPTSVLDLANTAVYSMALCPGGAMAAVGCDNGAIQLWDLASKAKTGTAAGHDGNVGCLVFSADGKTMASAAAGPTDQPRVWDIDAGKATERCRLEGKLGKVQCLALSFNGRLVAAGESPTAGVGTSNLRLWDATTGKEMGAVVADPVQVKGVYFGAHGQVLITVGPKTIKFWNVADVQGTSLGDKAVADKPMPGVTQANFDKIAKGMTVQDVIGLLGDPPPGADKIPPGGDATVQWSDGKTAAITVSFTHGIVMSKKSSLNWPVVWPADVAAGPPDKPAGVTQAMFDKIDKGMSADDLFRLLGKPPGADDALRTGKDAIFNWITADGNSIVDVTLSGGKVTRKATTATWPVVYPGDAAKNAPPDKPKPGANQANFDKIAKGMTEKDLVELLGPVGMSQPSLAFPGDQEKVWTAADGTIITVTLHRNPKLGGGFLTAIKTSSANWPVVWPGDAAQNPPPDKPKTSVTKENFDKIGKGMTLEQLTALLGGPPASTAKIVQPDFDTQWEWTAADGATIAVQASQGKTVNKTSTQKWPVVWPADIAKNPPPDKPPDKPEPPKAAPVTKENFDKIAKGMSRDALLTLFGPPAAAVPQPQPGLDERLVWQGDGVKILVGVANGKVVTKQNTADWPVVYPK